MIEYIQAPGYKGFHGLSLSSYGIKEAEKNAKAIAKNNFSFAKISFNDNKGSLNVFVNGVFVGIIYNQDDIKKIKAKRFAEMYFKIQEESIIGQKKVTQRYVPRLYAKEKEKGGVLDECKKIAERIISGKSDRRN